jgi:hypothetical protein
MFWKRELKMDKQRARQLYELADRLSKLDVNTLSEQQLQYRSSMIAKLKEEVKAIKEFAPNAGGGESGRWYTDDQMTDLVGDGWWNDLDISGDISKQQMIQEAQAWLDDQGYSVHVLNCKVNDDDMEWFIEGSFQNSNFAKKGVAEEFNGEYDDEAGMVQSNLRTMARAVNGLLDTIEDNDNLPEWAQEKIAKAEMMTTSVWDYLLSQKEQGMDPKVQGVAEAKADPTGSWVVYNGSKVTKFKTHSGAKAYAEKNGGQVASSEYYHDKIQKQGVAESGYIGGHNRDDPDYSGIDNVPKRIRVRKGSQVMAIPPSSLEQFKADGWTEVDQGVAEGSQRVDSLVTDALRVMKGPDVSDAVLALKRVLGDRAYNERRGFYSFYVKQIHGMYSQQGVEEADMSRRGFLGALAGAGLAAAGVGASGSAMAGPNDPGFVKKVQDKHFEMVEKNPRYANEHQALQLPFARGMSGNSAEMNKQWAIKTAQLLQKYGVKVNEGVAEAKKPSPKLTAVNIKKTDPVSEEINNEAYERLQKVFAFKNYEG